MGTPEEKLISIENAASTLELLEGIKNLALIEESKQESSRIRVSIREHTRGKMLVWKSQDLFVFDVCIRGHPQYNAVSVIRDLLKKQYPTDRWTRKTVEARISFKERSIGLPKNE